MSRFEERGNLPTVNLGPARAGRWDPADPSGSEVPRIASRTPADPGVRYEPDRRVLMARRAVAPLRRRARRLSLRGLVVAVAAVSLLAGAASAEGGFDDDDGSVHEPAVDALAAEGILDGTECGEGLICPGEPFERWVMAIWLIRALGESPSAVPTRFVDVDPAAWWAPYVERLAELRITLGCSIAPISFCPDASVTRGQMATFLAPANDLPVGSDPARVPTTGR